MGGDIKRICPNVFRLVLFWGSNGSNVVCRSTLSILVIMDSLESHVAKAETLRSQHYLMCPRRACWSSALAPSPLGGPTVTLPNFQHCPSFAGLTSDECVFRSCAEYFEKQTHNEPRFEERARPFSRFPDDIEECMFEIVPQLRYRAHKV